MPTNKKLLTKSSVSAKTAKSVKKVKMIKVQKPGAPSRQIKKPEYKTFRLSPRLRSTASKVPSALRIFKDVRILLLGNKRLFGGIVLVYLVLTIVLVKGLSASVNLDETKQLLQEAIGGNWGQVLTGFTLFGILVGSSSSASSDVAGAYQSVLLVIVSLTLIWALRQTHAGVKVGVKESFYKAQYPLIPFLLVFIVIALQLLPLVFSNFLYTVMFGAGLAVTAIERALWLVLIFLLVVWSIYMITSSTFALYIVTLPDVKPMQALRSARELVLHRRWTVMRKVLFLPFILLLIGAAIMVPIIIYLTPLAEWVFFALSMAALAVIHAYMYSLYRKLL